LNRITDVPRWLTVISRSPIQVVDVDIHVHILHGAAVRHDKRHGDAGRVVVGNRRRRSHRDVVLPNVRSAGQIALIGNAVAVAVVAFQLTIVQGAVAVAVIRGKLALVRRVVAVAVAWTGSLDVQ
jgi:hypothetical protein